MKLISAVTGPFNVIISTEEPTPEEIHAYQNSPIPFQLKMVCESYHETSGVSFERLWNWPSVRIFVGIWSTEDKSELRHLIRTLYLNQQKNLTGDNVNFKFILGTPSNYTSELKSRLTAENNTYGDIIMLDHMKDTGKAYYYWKWVAKTFNSTQYDYVAKTDDET